MKNRMGNNLNVACQSCTVLFSAYNFFKIFFKIILRHVAVESCQQVVYLLLIKGRRRFFNMVRRIALFIIIFYKWQESTYGVCRNVYFILFCIELMFMKLDCW